MNKPSFLYFWTALVLGMAAGALVQMVRHRSQVWLPPEPIYSGPWETTSWPDDGTVRYAVGDREDG